MLAAMPGASAICERVLQCRVSYYEDAAVRTARRHIFSLVRLRDTVLRTSGVTRRSHRFVRKRKRGAERGNLCLQILHLNVVKHCKRLLLQTARPVVVRGGLVPIRLILKRAASAITAVRHPTDG